MPVTPGTEVMVPANLIGEGLVQETACRVSGVPLSVTALPASTDTWARGAGSPARPAGSVGAGGDSSDAHTSY